jgi:hypothetical protein
MAIRRGRKERRRGDAATTKPAAEEGIRSETDSRGGERRLVGAADGALGVSPVPLRRDGPAS